MRRLVFLLLVSSGLLTGCASTIKSEVTAFHQWSPELIQQSFSFDRSDVQQQDLEYRSYEDLVRGELQRLGLKEAGSSDKAALSVKFVATITGRDVRIIETVLVDSWYGTPWYGPGYYSPRWGGWPGYGYPYYGAMWPSMPVAREQERRYTVFHRELKIKITQLTGGEPLLDVTVRSDGSQGNLAKVMPYLVQSAFTNFPGKSGEPRTVTLKMKAEK